MALLPSKITCAGTLTYVSPKMKTFESICVAFCDMREGPSTECTNLLLFLNVYLEMIYVKRDKVNIVLLCKRTCWGQRRSSKRQSQIMKASKLRHFSSLWWVLC